LTNYLSMRLRTILLVPLLSHTTSGSVTTEWLRVRKEETKIMLAMSKFRHERA